MIVLCAEQSSALKLCPGVICIHLQTTISPQVKGIAFTMWMKTAQVKNAY